MFFLLYIKPSLTAKWTLKDHLCISSIWSRFAMYGCCSPWKRWSEDCGWPHEETTRCWFWTTPSLSHYSGRDSPCGTRDARILHDQVVMSFHVSFTPSLTEENLWLLKGIFTPFSVTNVHSLSIYVYIIRWGTCSLYAWPPYEEKSLSWSIDVCWILHSKCPPGVCCWIGGYSFTE